MLSKKRSNISTRIEQSKNAYDEPSTEMGMSKSVGFGEVNKKPQKNASGVPGNVQINFSKDDKNRSRSSNNRAAFATTSSAVDMKVLYYQLQYRNSKMPVENKSQRKLQGFFLILQTVKCMIIETNICCAKIHEIKHMNDIMYGHI